MSSGPLDKRYVAYSILEFLDQEAKNESSTEDRDRRELVEVAMRNIESLFNVNLTNEELRASQPLDKIYHEFVTKNSGNENSVGQDVRPIIDTGEVYVVPEVPNEENMRLAESHSGSGNIKMIDEQFRDALENYTMAINLDGRNAVYFCNRASSYLKLNNLAKALRDCQVAIQLDAEYARAYDRMGMVYSEMRDHARAYLCYCKAAELEPTNETYANNVLINTQNIHENPNARTSTNPGNSGSFLHDFFFSYPVVSESPSPPTPDDWPPAP